MPRRSRTSNFFSGTSSSHHGSNVNNLGSVQQDVDSMDHDHHASIGWTGHSNSSVSFRNEIAVEELNAENGQLPAPVANIGTGQTSREEWHSEPNEDKTLTDEVGTNSDAIPQKLDLNVALEDVNENISQEVGRNSMLVIVENYENINQEAGRNSTLVNVENYENNSQEVGGNSTLVNVENYERNTRRRITPANEQGFPPSSLSSPIYVDDDTDQRGFPPSSLSSPIYIDDDTDELPNWVAGPSSASVLSVSPTILDSSSSAVTEEENSPDVFRSGSVQSALVSRTGWGNPGQNQLITSRNAPRNQGFPTGFAGFQRSSSPRFSPYNINGEFQNGFAAGARLSSNSPVFLRRNVAGEHAERLPIAVNRSRLRMASTGYERQITNHLQTSVRGRLGSRAFNPRDPRRALMIRDAGHNAAMPSFLPISHPLVASHFRATLVQHALELLRAINAAQYEHNLIVHGSDFDDNDDDDLEEEDDLHDNLRLDVDDMSYEELLALEDQIGSVNTGLSEEAILAGVGRYRFQAMQLRSQVEGGLCCICQDDYVDGEELGKLDCGHDFHFHCIKQWLIQKNTCPICKITGVAI